jgi:hypothetical protein
MAETKKGKKPLSDENILNPIGSAVRDAVGFSDDNIAFKQELLFHARNPIEQNR